MREFQSCAWDPITCDHIRVRMGRGASLSLSQAKVSSLTPPAWATRPVTHAQRRGLSLPYPAVVRLSRLGDYVQSAASVAHTATSASLAVAP